MDQFLDTRLGPYSYPKYMAIDPLGYYSLLKIKVRW